MEKITKKSMAQKIVSAETTNDSAKKVKKQFDETMDEIAKLWDINSESKYERKFVKLPENQTVLLDIPINLIDNTVILNTKFGNNPFLKVLEGIEKIDDDTEWKPALLQISSVGLRNQLLKYTKEAREESRETQSIVVSVYREGKGVETRYSVARLY